jgi:hypothetical protein
MNKKLITRSYFTLCTVALLSGPVLAYLDPGTVTYVVSMLAGLLIAAGAALAIFRRKVKLFFQNLGKKKTKAAPQQEAQAQVIDPMAEDED